ncbi:hypothetical protein BDF20DRAFT_620911 [Mycotypha africana]|uniref:uncharacterized protein n=1 Tax=Mycotypha africana TaxID=64632 RepID=UPI002300EF67|nr:uncharacterized protein BDF20DRAFT_620911 [Mycotypha africana]KAI8975626.1 hypothetical protein BDF20DRAFT_620911 [Mycotypha africana]
MASKAIVAFNNQFAGAATFVDLQPPVENCETPDSKKSYPRKRRQRNCPDIIKRQATVTRRRFTIVRRAASPEESDAEDIPLVMQPQCQHVWIGAICQENQGAIGVYFGDGDKRNYGELYQRKHIHQDVDYAYVLGTLKALQIIKQSSNANTVTIINTSYRDLPTVSDHKNILNRLQMYTAISGKSNIIYNLDLIEQIRELIDEKQNTISVRYISGRRPLHGQKSAMEIVDNTLTEYHLNTVSSLKISNSIDTTITVVKRAKRLPSSKNISVTPAVADPQPTTNNNNNNVMISDDNKHRLLSQQITEKNLDTAGVVHVNTAENLNDNMFNNDSLNDTDYMDIDNNADDKPSNDDSDTLIGQDGDDCSSGSQSNDEDMKEVEENSSNITASVPTASWRFRDIFSIFKVPFQ